jgi:hypothetical protein
MFSDVHIGHFRGKSRNTDDLLKLYGELDLGPDPCCDDRFHGDHPNDQGERTNKKLRVQPFYQRGRDGKMKRF